MAAAAAASAETTPHMPYQIVDPVMANAIQADAARKHPLWAEIIMRDLPEYPAAMVARLVTDAPTPYILIGLTAQLPPGLTRSDRQPADPPEVVEDRRDLVIAVAGEHAVGVGRQFARHAGHVA